MQVVVVDAVDEIEAEGALAGEVARRIPPARLGKPSRGDMLP
jgi:hypothetical protein